jgi:hypothetical protein
MTYDGAVGFIQDARNITASRGYVIHDLALIIIPGDEGRRIACGLTLKSLKKLC